MRVVSKGAPVRVFLTGEAFGGSRLRDARVVLDFPHDWPVKTLLLVISKDTLDENYELCAITVRDVKLDLCSIDLTRLDGVPAQRPASRTLL